jgi:hypothetical protein
MKLSLGAKLLLVLVLALSATAAGLAVRTTLALRGLEKRAALAQEAIDGLAAALDARQEMDAAARRNGADGGDASKRQLDAVTLKLAALGRRLDALEAGDIQDLGIETLIDRKLLEKMPQDWGGTRRLAQLDAVAARLGLSDAQKKRAAEIIDRAKSQLVEALRKSDQDGVTMSERIADRIKGPGNREQKMRGILTDLFDQNVPGTNDSYFTTLAGIRQGAVTDFQDSLTSDQLAAFNNLGIGVFAIDTGYTPFAEEMRNTLTGKP